MKNWQKNRNFRKFDNGGGNGTFTYVITVEGAGGAGGAASTNVEVNKEVYTAYAEIGIKMETMEGGLKRDRYLQDAHGRAIRDEHGQAVRLREREVSLDRLVDEGWDMASSEPSAEDVVLKKMEVEALYQSLELLASDERNLIDALFFKGMTEREYAKALGISKTALHTRKIKVLVKLKNFLEIF